MRIHVESIDYEATPQNTAIFIGSTLLNGIYSDIPPDNYVFIPEEYMTNYDEVVALMTEQGIATYQLEAYDPEAEPFCYMINARCRLFGLELDQLRVGDEG